VYQLLCELRSNPEFSPSSECKVLLVDEYQDLNWCDLSTIRMIASRTGAEVFASGDDDQSIYSFRHAHPAGIRRFDETYPGAPQLIMTECLRCGPDVVTLANWLIRQEPGRIDKDLASATPWEAEVHLLRFTNQAAEAEGVARIIVDEIERGTAPEDVLVLLKADNKGKVSKLLDEELLGRGIPSYLPRSRGEVDPALQVLLEYLLLSEDLIANNHIDDLALRSLLELLDNRIGAARLWRVTTVCLDKGLRFYEGIEYLRRHPSEFGGTGLRGLLDDVVCQRHGTR
jgi:DNA helicase II / ATP-dependent DNA helicase PcrA